MAAAAAETAAAGRPASLGATSATCPWSSSGKGCFHWCPAWRMVRRLLGNIFLATSSLSAATSSWYACSSSGVLLAEIAWRRCKSAATAGSTASRILCKASSGNVVRLLWAKAASKTAGACACHVERILLMPPRPRGVCSVAAMAAESQKTQRPCRETWAAWPEPFLANMQGRPAIPAQTRWCPRPTATTGSTTAGRAKAAAVSCGKGGRLPLTRKRCGKGCAASAGAAMLEARTGSTKLWAHKVFRKRWRQRNEIWLHRINVTCQRRNHTWRLQLHMARKPCCERIVSSHVTRLFSCYQPYMKAQGRILLVTPAPWNTLKTILLFPSCRPEALKAVQHLTGSV